MLKKLLRKRPALAWVASLYLCQGIPYAVVSLMASILFHQLGLANSLTALVSSLLLLAWFVKPLWAPKLEENQKEQRLIVILQALMALVLALIAISLMIPKPFWLLTLLFMSLAFLGACYDTASDSLYLRRISNEEQMRLVGFRSFFYQMGRLSVQSGFIMLAAYLQWKITFIIMSICMLCAMLWHGYALPKDPSHINIKSSRWLPAFIQSIKRYITMPHAGPSILFLLLFNFAEAQIIRVTPLFLLDKHSDGGLQLDLTHTGLLLGAFGLIALAIGSWLADFITPRLTLRKSLILMAWLMAASNLAYIFLAMHTQTDWLIIASLIFITQFVYGLANATYLGYTVALAQYHEGSISCFSISMAIMSLGWIIPGSFSGYLAETWHYTGFFIWTVLSGIGIALYTHYLPTCPARS